MVSGSEVLVEIDTSSELVSDKSRPGVLSDVSAVLSIASSVLLTFEVLVKLLLLSVVGTIVVVVIVAFSLE